MSTASRFGSDSRDENPRQSRSWEMPDAFRPRRAHVVAAVLVLLIILPAGYVAYCMATLPDNGGLVIEPTPSALIVEAGDGQAFASRGVFQQSAISKRVNDPRVMPPRFDAVGCQGERSSRHRSARPCRGTMRPRLDRER